MLESEGNWYKRNWRERLPHLRPHRLRRKIKMQWGCGVGVLRNSSGAAPRWEATLPGEERSAGKSTDLYSNKTPEKADLEVGSAVKTLGD